MIHAVKEESIYFNNKVVVIQLQCRIIRRLNKRFQNQFTVKWIIDEMIYKSNSDLHILSDFRKTAIYPQRLCYNSSLNLN